LLGETEPVEISLAQARDSTLANQIKVELLFSPRHSFQTGSSLSMHKSDGPGDAIRAQCEISLDQLIG
jgi:hypothetical protein